MFRGRRPPKARADSSDKVEPIKKMQTERHRSSSNLEDASKVEEQGKSDISSYLNSRANMRMPSLAMAMMKPGSFISIPMWYTCRQSIKNYARRS